MKSLFLFSLFSLAFAVQPVSAKGFFKILDTKIIETHVEATYSEGDSAILRTQFFSKPDNQNLEFDIVSKVNGVEQSVSRINDFELFSKMDNLALGSYTWEVQVVLQDARLAKDLRDAYSFYQARIAEIDLELQQATDPQEIAQLQAERANLVDLSGAVQNQLNQIRTPFLTPITKTFIVE